MAMSVPCECGNELLVDKDLLGQRIKCPYCVRIFIVPVTARQAVATAATVISTPAPEIAERFRPVPESPQDAVDFWVSRRASGGEIVALAHDKLYATTAYLREFAQRVESLKAGTSPDQALPKAKHVIRLDQICGIEANIHDRWLNVSWKNIAAEEPTETLVSCPNVESRDEIVNAIHARLGSSWSRHTRQETLREAISAPLAVLVVCGLLTVGLAIAANWLEGVDISLRRGGRLGKIVGVLGKALQFVGPTGAVLLGAPFLILGAIWLVLCFRKPPRLVTLTAAPSGTVPPQAPHLANDNAIQSSDIFLADDAGNPVDEASAPGSKSISDEYRRRVRRQVLVPVAGLLLIPATFAIAGSDWGEAAICVVLVTLFGFTFWNWRCPACNGYLGKGTNHRFCPKCGVLLKD